MRCNTIIRYDTIRYYTIKYFTPMWPLTRHNDAAEIVASLLILSAIQSGRKIFFPTYQTEVKNKPHQIEKKPDYHTAACGKSTTYTLDNMTVVSNYFINIMYSVYRYQRRGGQTYAVWSKLKTRKFLSWHAAPSKNYSTMRPKLYIQSTIKMLLLGRLAGLSKGVANISEILLRCSTFEDSF